MGALPLLIHSNTSRIISTSRTLEPKTLYSQPVLGPIKLTSRVPSDVLKIYFGLTDSFAQKSLDEQAEIAVSWYDRNAEEIPPLSRNNRENHRTHLRMIGEVLNLLPAVRSAEEAYQQYVAVFNALESKAAPSKKDIRMYCHDKASDVKSNQYLIRHYGFYILIFSPNVAIESFRRNTPASIDIDGKNTPDMALRSSFFMKTREDFSQLQQLLKYSESSLSKMPVSLLKDKNYTRTVFKAGRNKQDAWSQSHSPSQKEQQRTKNFSRFV